MGNCSFCDLSVIKEGLLDSAPNFYHRANCRGAIAPGHSMIISKKHFSCFGEMPPELFSEFESYVEKVMNRVEEFFEKLVIVEQGVHKQSVPHAHVHLLPKKSSWYDFSEEGSFVKMVPSEVKTSEISELKELRDVFKSEGEYVLIGEEGKLVVCHTKGYGELLGPVRQFPCRASGDYSLINWKKLSLEVRKKNSFWVEETIRRLRR
jgi:diadenosine tetraphosphate (Ap4A) HIT family hydrolase